MGLKNSLSIILTDFDMVGVLLSYFCVTDHLKTWWLKTLTMYLVPDSVGWQLAGLIWLSLTLAGLLLDLPSTSGHLAGFTDLV